MVSFQTITSISKKTKQLWSTKVGAFHYRNNFLKKDNYIIVSTSGDVWNKADPADGIYCLSITTGRIIWKFHTNGDANGISEHSDIIVGGTDNGELFAVHADTGNLISKYQTDTPFYAAPIAIKYHSEDVLVSVSYSGEVIIFRINTKCFEKIGQITGKFKSNYTSNCILSSNGTFIVASEVGEVLKVTLLENKLNSKILFKLSDMLASNGRYQLEIKGIGSILLNNSNLYVSYIRNTYDKHPPLCCFDIDTGNKIWDAKAVKTLSKKNNDYGNCRVSPVLIDDLLITTFGYNDSVHAFSCSTGKGEWKIALDGGLFQNWASPVVAKNRRLFVPRVNGMIHEVDIKKRKVVNSISVEIGRYLDQNDYEQYHLNSDSWEGTNPISSAEQNNILPYPSDILVSGLAATPVIIDDYLIAGGISGTLSAYKI